MWRALPKTESLSRLSVDEIKKVPIDCPNCGKTFKNVYSMSAHKGHCLGLSSTSQFDGRRAWNKGLSKKADMRVAKMADSLAVGYAEGKITPGMAGKSHSEEAREKMRKKRVEYLKKRNRSMTGWERRNARLMSYLEQWFWDSVVMSHNLNDCHEIINEKCESGFFIDFAFDDVRLAVELDGSCHFVNGISRIDHDKRKDSVLRKAGWTIYRIPYFDVQNDADATIKRFLDVLSALKLGNRCDNLLEHNTLAACHERYRTQ
jgi:very-short-patch-repair endonuclease